MQPDDRDFILGLAERLEAVGRPPWRDPNAMRAFHLHYAEETANATGDAQVVYVAQDDSGAPSGFVHVLEINDGLTGEREAYVATLAVSEAAEGQGIGRALLERAEAWTRERGLSIVTLEVFAQNQTARRFYDHLGYQEETLKMVKTLPSAPH